MKKFSCVILVLGLLHTPGCTRKNKFEAPPPPEVIVQNPVQEDVTIYHGFPGRSTAHDEVEIRARVKGYLMSIDFSDGQRVKEGDLLFTIEPDSYEAGVNSAEAKLAQTKAALKLAEATLQRIKMAYETEAVSVVDVLTAEADRDGSHAAVLEAMAALDDAKLNLSYTKVYAPMDGRLSRRTLSVGNLVGDGQSTLLTTLVVESPIDVYFNIDERSLLPFIRDGDRKERPGAGAPPLKLELADGTLHDEEGELDYYDPEIDPETGTLRARAAFPNQNLGLVPGLYGKILIPVEIENALLVPDLAIQQDMAGNFVMAVNAENTVESIYIVKGPLVGTQRVIEDDPTKDRHLSINDRIIVNGLQRARPGIPVTAKEAPADEVPAEE